MGKRVIIQGDDILLLVAPACRTPAAAIVNETASQKTLSEQVIEFVYCFFFFPLPAQDLPFKAQDGVPDGRLRFQPCSGCFQHPKHTALASFTAAGSVAGRPFSCRGGGGQEGKATGPGRDAGAGGAPPAAELQPAAQLSATQPFPRCLNLTPPGKGGESGVGWRGVGWGG